MPEREPRAKAVSNAASSDTEKPAGESGRHPRPPLPGEGVPTSATPTDESNRDREEKKAEPSPGARLRELLRASIGIAVTFDERGTIESIDPTAEMLLGYGSKELIGHSVVEILTLDPERPVMDADCPARLRRKDGSTFPAKLTLGRDGVRGRYVGIIHPDSMRREPAPPPVVPATRVSDERRRIGRELHDTVGQELSGVALVGGALIEAIREHERESARLGAKVVEGVRRAMEQVRALMTGLAPLEVRGDELTNALDELACRVRTSHAVGCTFHERGEVGATTDAAATHLYLIAQEAVTNALKHAQAKAIVIELSAPGDGLELRVADDGTGFDDPALRNPNGMGLRIMKERAGLAGGTLRVESAPGAGTTVTCILSERYAHEQERHTGGSSTAAGQRPQAGREGGDR
jgi:PAS domain S-box-containing protein